MLLHQGAPILDSMLDESNRRLQAKLAAMVQATSKLAQHMATWTSVIPLPTSAATPADAVSCSACIDDKMVAWWSREEDSLIVSNMDFSSRVHARWERVRTQAELPHIPVIPAVPPHDFSSFEHFAATYLKQSRAIFQTSPLWNHAVASPIPASPRPTAPPGFLVSVSGQEWASPGDSGASPGADMHTAVSVCAFTPSAPPVGPRVPLTLFLPAR